MSQISKNRQVFLNLRACFYRKIICFLSFFAAYNITFQYDTPCSVVMMCCIIFKFVQFGHQIIFGIFGTYASYLVNLCEFHHTYLGDTVIIHMPHEICDIFCDNKLHTYFGLVTLDSQQYIRHYS